MSVIYFLVFSLGLVALLLLIVALFAPRTVGNPPDWSNLRSTGTSVFWPPFEDSPYYDPATGDLIPRTKKQAQEYDELLGRIGEYGFDTYVNDLPYGMSERQFETEKAFMWRRWVDEEDDRWLDLYQEAAANGN